MTPEELAGAKRFEQWMNKAEIYMKNIIATIPTQTDKRRLPMFITIKKRDFKSNIKVNIDLRKLKGSSQLSLF